MARTTEQKAKQAAYMRRRYANNLKHRTKAIENAKRYGRAHPEAKKASRRKQLGILEAPPYKAPSVCEACKRQFPSSKETHLDHCHATGFFRGWLCQNCNLALGLVGDSAEGVRKLLDYIVRAYAMLDLRILK